MDSPHADYDSIPKAHLGFTDAQYSALKELIADIRTRHPEIKNDRQHIIGHNQYAPGREFDPGELFSLGQNRLPAITKK